MLLSKSFRQVRRLRRHFLFIFALIPAVALLSSCGGSSTAATPTITVVGAAGSVNVNGTVQFTATILNLSSTLVSWEVNSVADGNSTYGTIDANGLYTAPASVPMTNANVVTITAVAQAQTSLVGTATLTILPPAQISQITPPSATVAAGASQAFVPTVSGGGSIAVYWYINNAPCPQDKTAIWQSGFQNGNVNGTYPYGQISPSGNQGLYVAPQIPPPGGVIAITAVSQLDPTQFLCATANLTFGNGSLKGAYAFSTNGRLTNSTNSFFARAGSFTVDGNGNVSGGLEDSNQATPSVVTKQLNFTGSYSIGADGRGTIQFCENSNGAPCPSGSLSATAFFRVSVFSAQQAQLIEFSQPGSTSATVTSSGEMNLQDRSIFSASPLNLNLFGTYSFTFAGVTSGATEESAVGDFTANGNGIINAGGVSTPGTMDLNPGGTQTLTGSSYSISSNGRGTATIGSLNFSFYLVSAGRAKFIETDASPASILVGDAFKQQASTTCGWGLNALNGSMVFETTGAASGAGIADVGNFTASNGSVTLGSIDENNGGTVSSQLSTLTGSYTVDPCGRGTLLIGGHSYVFYPISTTSAALQETTAGVVAHGFLTQPQGGPFVNSSLAGSYTLNLSGTNAAGAAGKREDLLGQIMFNGSGTVTGGALDTNNFGVTQTGVAISSGTYLPVPAGTVRGTALISPTHSLVLYLVSPTHFYVLDTDTTGTAIGSIYNQY